MDGGGFALLLVVAVFIIIYSLVRATSATKNIGDYKGWEKNAKLSAARSRLTTFVIISWVAIFLAIVGIGVAAFYGGEILIATSSLIVKGVLLVLIFFAILMGIISATSAVDINGSGLTSSVEDIEDAYKDAAWSAGLSLAFAGLVFFGFAVYLSNSKKEVAATKETKEADAKSKSSASIPKSVGGIDPQTAYSLYTAYGAYASI